MSEETVTTTNESSDAPQQDNAPVEPQSEPHGDDDGTDWVAEARKWEKRAKANSDAAARLAEIEEANKSELQKAQERADAAEKAAKQHESELLRLQVAADKGLTPAQAKRLTGDNREELEADADELLELLSPPEQAPPPGARPKALHNGNGTDGDKSFDPQALANSIYERRNF